jgi:hypothetical protein
MDDIVARMSRNLREFAGTVGFFTAMVEQECPLNRKIRWWRWNGEPRGKQSWDIVRTIDGTWMGWPSGNVVHPPLYAQAYPNARRNIILSVDEFGGFVVPPELPYAKTFETSLCTER